MIWLVHHPLPHDPDMVKLTSQRTYAFFAMSQLALLLSIEFAHMIFMQRCAITLEDTDLLAKLAPGDMVALEAKYHTKCLANLYNRARAATESAIADTGVDARVSGIAFAELVTFMEENRREEGIVPTFKLSDLARMYKARLEQLGVSVEGRIHSTRLKARSLAVIPDLQLIHKGEMCSSLLMLVQLLRQHVIMTVTQCY